MRQLLSWSVGAWPVSAIVALWALSLVSFFWVFPDANAVYEVFAVIAQITGGAVFALITINNHLVALGQPTLCGRSKRWWSVRPWRRFTPFAVEATIPSPLGSPSILLRVTNDTSLDGRLTGLEADIKGIREAISKQTNQFEHLKVDVQKEISGLQSEYQSTLHKIHVSGLGLQVFSVLLAASGTVATSIL